MISAICRFSDEIIIEKNLKIFILEPLKAASN